MLDLRIRPTTNKERLGTKFLAAINSVSLERTPSQDCFVPTLNAKRTLHNLLTKAELIDDEVIKNFIADSVERDLKSTKANAISQKLQEYIDLLDACNVANGKYSSLHSEPHKYYQHLATEAPEKAEEFAEYAIADKTKVDIKPEQDLKDNFRGDLRTEKLKSYITAHSQDEPEITQYLYTNYYLPRLDKTVQQQCKQILNKFEVKVFLANEDCSGMNLGLNNIYEELNAWQEASNGDASFPFVLDLSKLKTKFWQEHKVGDTDTYNIEINGDSVREISNALRHELTHCNTFEPSDWRKIHGVMNNPRYEEELKNSGIEDYLRKYAHTCREEFIAVASEGDYSKYSDEFKQALKSIGLPDWIFDLKPLIQTVELN